MNINRWQKSLLCTIFLIILVCVSSCKQQVPSAIPSPSIMFSAPASQTVSQLTPTPTLATSVLTATSTEAVQEPKQEFTQIFIDGDRTDWSDYKILITDDEGDDHDGVFDIASVRAFTNDTFLYVLIETYFPATDFVQLDLDIRSGSHTYVISFGLERDQNPNMGETTGGKWVEIGEITGSYHAMADAIEIKLPLTIFDDPANLTIMNIRPMTGECCDADWIAIDEINEAKVSQLTEKEPSKGEQQGVRICAPQIPAAIPFGSFEPAEIELLEDGYSVEWFIPPGKFNMPMEVFITPQDEILVQSTRSGVLSRIASDGSVIALNTELHAYYQGDIDQNGNIYLLQSPSTEANIAKISPDGTMQILASSPELSSVCICPLEVGPDANLYAAISTCEGESTFVQVTQSGQVTRLVENFPDVWALHTTTDGRLLAATESGEILEISMQDYSLNSIGQIPGGGISPSGLTSDQAGNLYLSTGSRDPNGQIFQISPDGNVSKLADIPQNGLSGIEWRAAAGEIVGVQLVWGGVIAVKPDGSLREIIPGNGVITPFGIAFSPCGELVSANDDGGMMSIIDPMGTPDWLTNFVSFIPPAPFIAFDPDGTIYASEGAPSFEGRIVRVKPGDSARGFIGADYPSGIARRVDGVLFVSESGSGKIFQINPDGSETIYMDGLDFPQALALDALGNLYAITGPSDFIPDLDVFPVPLGGDTLIQIKPNGDIHTVRSGEIMLDIAVSPQGDLFVTESNRVMRIASNWKEQDFAHGFLSATGLAFDLSGYLYVADEEMNGILRIASFPQGIITGTVSDASGKPIENARVQALSIDPIVVGQVVFTDGNGRFELPAAPRKYWLEVTAEGFELFISDEFAVITDGHANIEIALMTSD